MGTAPRGVLPAVVAAAALPLLLWLLLPSPSSRSPGGSIDRNDPASPGRATADGSGSSAGRSAKTTGGENLVSLRAYDSKTGDPLTPLIWSQGTQQELTEASRATAEVSFHVADEAATLIVGCDGYQAQGVLLDKKGIGDPRPIEAGLIALPRIELTVQECESRRPAAGVRMQLQDAGSPALELRDASIMLQQRYEARELADNPANISFDLSPLLGVVAAGTQQALAESDSQGSLSFTNLVPGVAYSIRVKSPMSVTFGDLDARDQIEVSPTGRIRHDSRDSNPKLNATSTLQLAPAEVLEIEACVHSRSIRGIVACGPEDRAAISIKNHSVVDANSDGRPDYGQKLEERLLSSAVGGEFDARHLSPGNKIVRATWRYSRLDHVEYHMAWRSVGPGEAEVDLGVIDSDTGPPLRLLVRYVEESGEPISEDLRSSLPSRIELQLVASDVRSGREHVRISTPMEEEVRIFGLPGDSNTVRLVPDVFSQELRVQTPRDQTDVARSEDELVVVDIRVASVASRTLAVEAGGRFAVHFLELPNRVQERRVVPLRLKENESRRVVQPQIITADGCGGELLVIGEMDGRGGYFYRDVEDPSTLTDLGTIRLQPGCIVELHFVDAAGHRVPDKRYKLTIEGWPRPIWLGKSDANGSATIEGVPPNIDLTMIGAGTKLAPTNTGALGSYTRVEVICD